MTVLGIDPGLAHAGFIYFDVDAIEPHDTPVTIARRIYNLLPMTFTNLDASNPQGKLTPLWQWLETHVTKPVDYVFCEDVVFRPNMGGRMILGQASVYGALLFVDAYLKRAKILAPNASITYLNRAKVFSLWGLKVRSHDKEKRLHEALSQNVKGLKRVSKHVKDALAVALAGLTLQARQQNA